MLPGCARAADPATEVPERAIIELTITPGKPGAPTERVVVSHSKDGDTLRVERDAGDPAQKQAESVALPAADFPPLWKIVISNKLLAFRPVPKPGQVFDFGAQSLKVDCRAATALGEEKLDGKAFNSATWEAAIANESSVKPLFSAVTALARKHCKKVELVYFR